MEIKEIPLVSVGIPTYNRVDWLKGAIDSVLNQNYSNIDIVVCDNASTDGTEKFMQEYCAKYENIKYYRNHTNLGLIKNFRKVAEKLKGKYIFFLPDDDYLLDGAFFQEAVEMMEKNEKILLVRGIVQDYQMSTGEISFIKYIDKSVSSGADYFMNYCNSGTEFIHGFFALMRKEAMNLNKTLDNTPFLDTTAQFRLFLKGDVGFLNRCIGGMRRRDRSYPENTFLQKEVVINNLKELDEIYLIAQKKNIFKEKELAEWKIKWQLTFLFGYPYNLKDEKIKDSFNYIEVNYPELHKRIIYKKIMENVFINKVFILYKNIKKAIRFFKN